MNTKNSVVDPWQFYGKILNRCRLSGVCRCWHYYLKTPGKLMAKGLKSERRWLDRRMVASQRVIRTFHPLTLSHFLLDPNFTFLKEEKT